MSSVKAHWPGMSNNEFDKKLEKSIKKLKEAYATQFAKKKCTKFVSIEDRPQIIELTKKKPVQKKTIKKSSSPKMICKATKMDGKKCTASAKDCSDFCGRHGPKSKK